MAYATIEDLEMTFGKSNVRKWADINNTKNSVNEDTRMQWALDEASAELDERLRMSAYQFPLEAEPFPKVLVRTTSYLAGKLLYEARGLIDSQETDFGKMLEKRVDKFVYDIVNRRLILDVPVSDLPIETNDVPMVVNWDLEE
jgi:phage gp36-like protein